MKLTKRITGTILAIVFTSALSAATIPDFKQAPMVKAPVTPKVISTPKVPVVPQAPAAPKVPAVPKVVTAPKVPVIPQVVSAPKIPVVKAPSVPKIPAVKVPVTPRTPAVVKTPVVKVPVTPRVPVVATQMLRPQPAKTPQTAPKIPAVTQTRMAVSNKQTESRRPVVAVKAPAPASRPASIQKAMASPAGGLKEKTDSVARQAAPHRVVSGTQAQTQPLPDSDADGQEMAVISPGSDASSAPAPAPNPSDHTDPATKANELWVPWWAPGSASEGGYSTTSHPLGFRPAVGTTPREPSSGALLLAPNPVKQGSASVPLRSGAASTPREPTTPKIR